jgi:hypothetical protein
LNIKNSKMTILEEIEEQVKKLPLKGKMEVLDFAKEIVS